MKFAGDVAALIVLGLQQPIRQFAQLFGLLHNFGVTLLEFMGADMHLFFQLAGEGAQLFLALAQSFLYSDTFRNVARHRELNHFAIGHAQRGGVALHMMEESVETHDVEFERTFFSGADSFIKGTKSLAVVGRNEVVYVLADYRFRTTGANHREAGRIHVQQSAILGDELDTFGSGLNNCAETFFSFAQGSLGTLTFGNVSRYL